MSDVSQWSTSAASNNSASPNGAPEGMAPSGVNDTMREMMAAVARWYSDSDGTLTTGGTSNAYTLTTNSTHAALADIPLLVFEADRANTGAATLNVDTLGAKAIQLNGVALTSGTFAADSIYTVAYNSTNDAYDLLSPTDAHALYNDIIGQSFTYYVDSGAADAYVITPSPAIAAYAEGQRFVFRATNTNTGASTLNVNGLGALTVFSPDGALSAGDIVNGGYYEVVMNENSAPDSFVLQSPVSRIPAYETRTITSGGGLTGGGDLSANRTLAVGAGTGITVNADDVALNTANDRNVDHSAVDITSGNGLTGGGSIASSRTLAVGAGTGITVNADDVELNTNGLSTLSTLDSSNDHIIFNDVTDSTPKKITTANFTTAMGFPTANTKGSSQTLVGTTLVDVTSFTGIALDNARSYRLECFLYCFQNTGNFKFQWSFTNTPVREYVIYDIVDQSSVQNLYVGLLTDTVTLTGQTDAENNVLRIVAHITSNVTTGGTFKLQAAQETASGATTIQPGAHWSLTDVT